MEKNKVYVYLVIALLFGVCLGVPLGGADTIVGYNNWTHDTDNNFLVPTNTSVDVSLNNNSLIYSNLSSYAGDNVTWDGVDMEFDVSADGTSKWNEIGGATLFTKINGIDVQINGSLTLGSFLDMDFNDINNVNDLVVDNDVDIGNDLHVNDKIEHLGDSDTYLDFNGNQILFFAGGTQILNMQTVLATFGVDVTFDENITVANTLNMTGGNITNANLSEYAGDNIVWDSINMEFDGQAGGVGDSLWNDDGTTLFTSTDGRNIQINNTLSLDNNSLDYANLYSYAGENTTFDNNTMQFNVASKGWLQNGFVNTIDSTISFTDGNRTFAIEPTASSFDYYVVGVKYTVDSYDGIVIDDTEGLWIIYYDDSTLTAIHSPTHKQLKDIYLNKSEVAFVYWDSDNSKGQLLEERHGLSMSPYTHIYLHETVGTRYAFGLALNNILVDEDGDTDTHAQFGTDIGEIFDEDLVLGINAVGSTTGLQIWHRDTSLWTFTTNAGFSMVTTGSGRLAWDDAGTLTEVTNGDFVLCHVFVGSFNHSNPVVAVGQAEYASKKLAQEAAVTEINNIVSIADISPELKPIATVIFQTSNSYGNSIKARIVSTDEGDDYVDWTASDLSPGRAASDHGNLAGLGDDDHTQYSLVDGTRNFTNDITVDENITVFGGNSSNWNDAFGWGDHSLVGYLTSLLWDRSGTALYTATDGDSVQINSTLTVTDNATFEQNVTIDNTLTLTNNTYSWDMYVNETGCLIWEWG